MLKKSKRKVKKGQKLVTWAQTSYNQQKGVNNKETESKRVQNGPKPVPKRQKMSKKKF